MCASASVPHRIPPGAVSPDLCWQEFDVSASELLLTVFQLTSFLLNLVPLSDYSWSTGPGKAGLRVENSTFRIAWFPPSKVLTGWHLHGSVSCICVQFLTACPRLSWRLTQGIESLPHTKKLYGFLARLYGIASSRVFSWELIFSRVVSMRKSFSNGIDPL